MNNLSSARSAARRRSPAHRDLAAFEQPVKARLTLALGFLSVAALLWYFAHQQLLLYGDAVAHINIARRVVDNRHPLESYGQLGTVWLPLQHIAMLPFVWSDALWRSGIAGALPGMLAFVVGALGIFRLVRGRASRDVACLATAAYALNPNLLYMQATAMNEPIFLAFFIWSLAYLDEFVRAAFQDPSHARTSSPAQAQRALEGCGIALAAAAYTRYDGWFNAIIILPMLLGVFTAWWRRNPEPRQRRILARSLVEVFLLNALVPVYWLIYTYNVSGYALDFLSGPYSAKAIALRSTAQGAPPYPGQYHPLTAALYFLKAAKLNVGEAFWGQLLFVLALVGTAVAVWRFRSYGIFLLLWLPLPFYTLSIAYGSVPVYLPVWYPFSYYNVRYGLELLPAFAVLLAIAAAFLLERTNSSRMKLATYLCLGGIVAGSYLSAYRQLPITLREAQVNSQGRLAMELALAKALNQVPARSTLLMYEADHAGALQHAGVPLRQVISESAHPDWEWALLDPAHHADYLVACDGDPVWTAVRHRRSELTEVLSISVPAQSHCVIYRTTR